jgi:hypothetical protein
MTIKVKAKTIEITWITGKLTISGAAGGFGA